MNYPLRKPKKNPRKERQKELNPLEKVATFLPKSIHSQLRLLSMHRGLPVSRLLAIAVDNELDCQVPFNYPCDLPTNDYAEFTYAKEAGRIIAFLQTRMPNGTGRDMLTLCRREMGIESKDTFLGALRELYEKDILEEFIPQNAKFSYYKPDYRYVRIKGMVRKENRTAQTDEVENESE